MPTVAGWLTSAEAAERLGVARSRIGPLLASGRLRGHLLERWEIDPASVERLLAVERPAGRPFTARNAWAILALVDPEAGLRTSVTAKERSRLGGLLTAAGGPRGLSARLRSRARPAAVRAHPGVLAALVSDAVEGGAAALPDATGERPVGGTADLYVPAAAAQELHRRYALSLAGVPNVLLHVVDDDVWPFRDGVRIAPAVVGALDLLEAGDERSVRAARGVLGS